MELAERTFSEVVGHRSLHAITRNDALKFREWWGERRIAQNVTSANTANKTLGALRKIFRVVNETHRLRLENPFQGLRLIEPEQFERVSLTRDWLETVMLQNAALEGLDEDARGIVLVMADTGAHLNEIAGLAQEDIQLDAEIPHIVVRANSIRSLKTAQSTRTIPLVGTTLSAMQRNPAGLPQYAGKNASASAAINKYLRKRRLLPEGATLYGLRHGFQDRLIEVEAPERIQADLMGHKTLRPKYGRSPSLAQMRKSLERPALTLDSQTKCDTSYQQYRYGKTLRPPFAR